MADDAKNAEENEAQDKAGNSKNEPKPKDSDKNLSDDSTSTNDGAEKRFAQEDVDRILNERLERERKKMERTISERLRKESEEQKLLEEQQWKELAERREQELAELRKANDLAEREKKVTALLDKKNVTDPGLRKIFYQHSGDLTDLNDVVDGFLGVFNSVVDRAVAERLGSNQPPSKGDAKTNTKPISKMTDDEKIQFIKEVGADKFAEITMRETEADLTQ